MFLYFKKTSKYDFIPSLLIHRDINKFKCYAGAE